MRMTRDLVYILGLGESQVFFYSTGNLVFKESNTALSFEQGISWKK